MYGNPHMYHSSKVWFDIEQFEVTMFGLDFASTSDMGGCYTWWYLTGRKGCMPIQYVCRCMYTYVYYIYILCILYIILYIYYTYIYIYVYNVYTSIYIYILVERTKHVATWFHPFCFTRSISLLCIPGLRFNSPLFGICNSTVCVYIWVNYNISQTWIKAILGWFPLLSMIPVRSQWGRYNLPRYIYIYMCVIYIYMHVCG